MRFNLILALGTDAIQSIHRIGYDDCEECTTPCAVELPYAISELPLLAFSAAELIPLGGGETFDWYKKQLQLLTFQATDRRGKDFTWMLKCPFHLPYLSELHLSFPGSTVVWTHRDPCECIASCCSLYEQIMLFTFESSSIDKKALGKYVMLYTKMSLDKAFESLKKYEKTFKIVHIRYADTLKDPKGMVKQILAKANVDYTAEYEKLLDDYLAKNAAKREEMKKNKGNKAELHHYTLEEYGLSREIVEKEFHDYIVKYDLNEGKKGKH